jgi:hypothetical protein
MTLQGRERRSQLRRAAQSGVRRELRPFSMAANLLHSQTGSPLAIDSRLLAR